MGLRHLHYWVVLFLLLPAGARAAGAGGADMPWTGPLQQLLDNLWVRLRVS